MENENFNRYEYFLKTKGDNYEYISLFEPKTMTKLYDSNVVFIKVTIKGKAKWKLINTELLKKFNQDEVRDAFKKHCFKEARLLTWWNNPDYLPKKGEQAK